MHSSVISFGLRRSDWHRPDTGRVAPESNAVGAVLFIAGVLAPTPCGCCARPLGNSQPADLAIDLLVIEPRTRDAPVARSELEVAVTRPLPAAGHRTRRPAGFRPDCQRRGTVLRTLGPTV